MLLPRTLNPKVLRRFWHAPRPLIIGSLRQGMAWGPSVSRSAATSPSLNFQEDPWFWNTETDGAVKVSSVEFFAF